MKHVKSIFLLFWVVVFCPSCAPKELPTILEQGDGFITVKLSHQTTESEMQNIQATLAEKRVQFDYNGSVFFENGRLRQLELTVSIPNVGSGRTRADLMTLQTRYIGFVYNKNQNPVFKIGEI